MELLGRGPSVIASGGGMVMNEGVPERLEAHAITVWLRADISELSQRLEKSQNRPLLRGQNIADVLNGMLEKREQYYGRANFIVDTTGLQPQEAASRVAPE